MAPTEALTKITSNCSTVLITAALEDDRAGRFPDLGFTMAVDGTLSKIAVNSDQKQVSQQKVGQAITQQMRQH